MFQALDLLLFLGLDSPQLAPAVRPNSRSSGGELRPPQKWRFNRHVTDAASTIQNTMLKMFQMQTQKLLGYVGRLLANSIRVLFEKKQKKQKKQIQKTKKKN